MRIEESDIVVREVDVWKFVKEIVALATNGYKVKSYDLSVFSPQFDGVAYCCVMEKIVEASVAKEATNEAEQATEEKPKPRPPVRQSKKQAE